MRNIPVSDSVVYRGLHQRRDETGSSDTNLILERNGKVRAEVSEATESSKWAFLKRLMEIEEEHDKRRLARERQERNLRQAKLRAIPSNREAGKRSQVDPEPDPLSRWTTAQILTETSTDTPDSENEAGKFTGCALPKEPLPEKCPKHHNCQTSKSSTENGHARNPYLDHTTADNGDPQRKESRPLSEERRLSPVSPPCSPVSSASDRSRSPNAFRQHQHKLYASSASFTNAAHQGDFQSSVGDAQPASSRTVPTTPRPTRQLRLPPILLPRVYTMKPRPLKFLDFPTPTKLPGPVTEAQWDELRECRYIRHVTRRKPVHNTV